MFDADESWNFPSMSLVFQHGPAQRSPIITLAEQKKDNYPKQPVNPEEEGRGEDLKGKIRSAGLNSIHKPF